LQPGNLVFDDNHRLHVCDFGSSTLLFPGSSGDGQVGTPMYMAPEIFEGEEHSVKVDVYAIALILYEIITETHGFWPDLEPIRIVNLICNRGFRASIPPKVLPWVGELIAKCWTPDPDERPAFSTIERILQSNRFQILPGADGDFLMRSFQDLCCQIGDSP
jgi:serine/threonine protein kinase